MVDDHESVNQKHLHSIIFIGILILILTIYLKSFPIIIILFEFIIFTILQIYFTNYVLYSKQFMELLISTVLFIFIFIVFYPYIYDNVNVDDNLMIVLFYFNWYYITHLITNMLSGNFNTFSQYQ
jgi:hypothetical protein